MEILHQFEHLFQASKDGIAAIIRIVSIKDIERDFLYLVQTITKIAICHGHFIKIHNKGQISFI